MRLSNKKKNVLLIMTVVPSDSGMGVQKRAAAHLKALSENRRVYLIIFEAQPERAAPFDQKLAKLCEFVTVIAAPERPRKHLFSFPPFPTISELLAPRSERMVPEDTLLRQSIEGIKHISFDEAFCFRVRSALIFERMFSISSLEVKRKIVDYDDIESVVHVRSNAFASDSKGFEQGFIEKIMLWRLKKIENKFLRSFQDVLVCSEQDKQTLELRNPLAKIHAVPNSVPLEAIQENNRNNEELNILFVGTMSYGPNEDGILWFCNEILPLIREKTKIALSLYIVGFNPPQSVCDLEKIEAVTVTGGVDSVAPYYQESDIVIAPIRYGGGTRIKILEAMGFQRAVISTTIGAEGINVSHGQNILIADTPEAFAKSCVELIENKDYCQEISAAARNAVEENYCDLKVGQTLQRILNNEE